MERAFLLISTYQLLKDNLYLLMKYTDIDDNFKHQSELPSAGELYFEKTGVKDIMRQDEA